MHVDKRVNYCPTYTILKYQTRNDLVKLNVDMFLHLIPVLVGPSCWRTSPCTVAHTGKIDARPVWRHLSFWHAVVPSCLGTTLTHTHPSEDLCTPRSPCWFSLTEQFGSFCLFCIHHTSHICKCTPNPVKGESRCFTETTSLRQIWDQVPIISHELAFLQST